MLAAPKTDIKNPIAAEVPIAILIGYPNNFIAGTPKDPPPIPKGTAKNPSPTPIIILNIFEIGFGFSPTFSLKKIKNRPTKKENTEKNNINGGVFKLEANTVPSITPKNEKVVIIPKLKKG